MKIKTRDSLKTIKTFDRGKSFAEKTKSGFENPTLSRLCDSVRTPLSEFGRQAESFQEAGNSPTNYAGNQIQEIESHARDMISVGSKRIGDWGVQETRNNVREWKHKPKKPKPKIKTPKKRPQNTVKTAQSAKEKIQYAAKTAVKAAKSVGKAIVAAVKATVATVKGIVAAIIAGGWVAVLIIVLLVVVGAAIGAVCSIFVPSDDGGYSVSYMYSSCESEYRERENQIIEMTPHDYLEISGDEPKKRDMIAVYAVLSKSQGKDFTTLDEENQALFHEIFFSMNTLTYFTSESEETVIRRYMDEDGNLYEIEEIVMGV